MRKGEMVDPQHDELHAAVDHRVVDGAMGAQFLQTLRGLHRAAGRDAGARSATHGRHELRPHRRRRRAGRLRRRDPRRAARPEDRRRRARALGGICLNWGCIPTKALLRTSEVYELIKHADAYGLSVKDVVATIAKKIVERSRKVANQLSNGVKGLMKKNKITVFDGTAKLAGKGAAQARRGDERQEQRRRSPPRT